MTSEFTDHEADVTPSREVVEPADADGAYRRQRDQPHPDGWDSTDGWEGRDPAPEHRPESEGTPDGSVYLTRSPRYDGKTDHFFNESGDMTDAHGHVVEGRDSTPERTVYDFVRDVDGTVYVDRR
jgi:hypothetical protein